VVCYIEVPFKAGLTSRMLYIGFQQEYKGLKVVRIHISSMADI